MLNQNAPITYSGCIFIDRPTKTILTTGTPGNAVVPGTTVTLTCSADGYPAPTYTIRRGSTEVSNSGGRVDINNIQLNDEDEPYSCVPSNKVGDGPTEQITIIVLGLFSHLPRLALTRKNRS